MAVVMRVGAKLDEASANRAAEHAERKFHAAGARAGQGFGQNFEQQVEHALSERALEKSASKIVSQMSRAGKTSAEAFNQAIAAEATRTGLAADKIGETLKGRLGLHGQSAGAQFAGMFMGELGKVAPGVANVLGSVKTMGGEAMEAIGGGGLAAAGGVLAIGAAAIEAGKHLYEIGQAFDNVAKSIEIRTGKTGNELHELSEAVDHVAVHTASSIQDIGQIVGSVSQAFKLSGEPLEHLTKQIADLDRMTGEKLNVRDLGKVVRAFGNDFRDASGALDEAKIGAAVDELKVASENTGAPIEELLGSLKAVGTSARSLHLDFGQTAAIIDMFDKAGLDATSTTRGLNKEVAEAAKHHIDLQTVLQQSIEEIHHFLETGQEQQAQDLALKLFGTKGAQLFIDAVRNGKLNVEELNEALKKTDSEGHIRKLNEDTMRWADTWTIVKNRIEDAVKPLAGPVFDTLQHALRALADPDAERRRDMTIEQALPNTPTVTVNPQNALGGLGIPGRLPGAPAPAPGAPGGGPPPPGMQIDPNNPLTRALLGGAGGPGLAPGFNLPPTPPPAGGPGLSEQLEDDGKPKPVSVPYPAGYGAPPQAGETEEHWKLRQEAMEKQHALAEKRAELDELDKSHLAKEEDKIRLRNEIAKAQMESDTAGRSLSNYRPKIETPYAPGFGAAPRPGEPEKLYTAEQGMLEAQHKRAQALATLQQLETTGGVTDAERAKARNELAEAEKGEYEAQIRLREAALNTSKDLGELGAQIDNDFGISKGIPGIVENMTKTIANLAAAPMLGKLAAFSNINEAQTGIEGGYGLIGIMGAKNLAAGKSPIFGNPLGGAAADAGYSSIGGGGGLFGSLLGLGNPNALKSNTRIGQSPLVSPGGAGASTGTPSWGVPSALPGGAGGSFTDLSGFPKVPPPDENTIRSQIQQMFGIPNTFGTGSWENAAHDADGLWHHSLTHDKKVPGYAFDFRGTDEQMDALSNWIQQNAAPETLELIHQGPGFHGGISRGKPWTPGADLLAQHGGASSPGGHVHWATTALPSQILGGNVPAGLAAAGGGGGAGSMSLADAPSGTVPVFVVNMGAGGLGGGVGVGGGGGIGAGAAGGAGAGSANLTQDAAGRWHSSDPWWEANIQAESGGQINPPGNPTHFGLFQFSQGTWDAVARQVAPEWVGKNPGTAPADVQARMAQANYNQNTGNLAGQWSNDYVRAHPGGTTGQIWSSGAGSGGAPQAPAPAPEPPAPPMAPGMGQGDPNNPNDNRPGGGGNAPPRPAAPPQAPAPGPAPGPTMPAIPGLPPGGLPPPSGEYPNLLAPPGGGIRPFNPTDALGLPPPPAAPAPGPRPAPAGPAGLGAQVGKGPATVHPADLNTRTPGGAPGPGGGPTRIGGVEPQSNPGGGQAGIASGGSIDTAIGMAASALDVMAPGAGQAAQVGIKLANRAIQYGSQVAGIAASGLMETFLPTGGSELANHNWLGKIMGGIAGARPAIPNLAGGAGAAPMGPDQGGGKTADGDNSQTNNITINQASAQPANDITHALTVQNNNQPALGR